MISLYIIDDEPVWLVRISRLFKEVTLGLSWEAPISCSLMEMLDNSFFQSHKAYIENLKRIKEIRRTEKLLVMDTSESCPCSFRLFGETCRRFLELHK